MPGRSFEQTDTKYRYGFNGQEKSDEIFEGSTTALFWEYDSRTGRRWNVDPKAIEFESPYAVNRNCPIVFSDPDGDFPGLPFLIGFVADVVAQVVFEGKSLSDVNYVSAAFSGLSAQFGGALGGLKYFKSGSKIVRATKQVAADVIVSTAESTSKQLVEDGKVDLLKLATDVGGDLTGGAVTKPLGLKEAVDVAEVNLDRAIRKTKDRTLSRQQIKINPAKTDLTEKVFKNSTVQENVNNTSQAVLDKTRKKVETLSPSSSSTNTKETPPKQEQSTPNATKEPQTLNNNPAKSNPNIKKDTYKPAKDNKTSKLKTYVRDGYIIKEWVYKGIYYSSGAQIGNEIQINAQNEFVEKNYRQ